MNREESLWAAIERVLALHTQEKGRGVIHDHRTGLKVIEIQVCGYCASLCHPYEALRCQEPPDAVWPCDTIKALGDVV